MEMLFRLNSFCPMFDSFRTWDFEAVPGWRANTSVLQKHGSPVRGAAQAPALDRRVGQWAVRWDSVHGHPSRGGVMQAVAAAARVCQRGAREGDHDKGEKQESALFHGPLLVRDGAVPVDGRRLRRKRWDSIKFGLACIRNSDAAADGPSAVCYCFPQSLSIKSITSTRILDDLRRGSAMFGRSYKGGCAACYRRDSGITKTGADRFRVCWPKPEDPAIADASARPAPRRRTARWHNDRAKSERFPGPGRIGSHGSASR